MNENELLDVHFANGNPVDKLCFCYLLAYLRHSKKDHKIVTTYKWELGERRHYLVFQRDVDFQTFKYKL